MERVLKARGYRRLWFGGGSSGATSNTVAKFEPPSYTQPYWQDYVGQAAAQTSQPYQQYAGVRIAPLNQMQQWGLDLAYQRATNGAPDLNAARGAAADVAMGDYVDNPYYNPALTQQAIQRNAQAMGQAFSTGQAAQNDALASRAGIYGGSAWGQKQSMDAANLASQVGQMASNYNMNLQNSAAGDYRGAVNQMLSGGQLGGNLAQDDWTAAKALTGVGDAERQYTQALLDEAYNNWNSQYQYPWQQLDLLGSALTRASGGTAMGSTSTTNTGAGMSPLAGLLGLGAAGYSLMT